MEIHGSHLNKPLDDEMARYAARLAQPVFWEDAHPPVERNVSRNGSGCFLRLGGRTLAVTCQHVVARYRELRSSGAARTFQFGRIAVDPDRLLIAESAAVDLATIDVTSLYDVPGGVSPAACIDPPRWPPGDLDDKDVVAFAGFPGVWRDRIEPGYLRFYAFTAGASGVEAVGAEQFFTRLELDSCMVALAQGIVIGSIGGLSGGPVFAWRKGAVLSAEFVGVAREYIDDWDLLRISRANNIAMDGTLAS